MGEVEAVVLEHNLSPVAHTTTLSQARTRRGAIVIVIDYSFLSNRNRLN